MQMEVTVPEVFNVFKEIGNAPEKLFDMMRLDLREMAGDTLSVLMEWELTIHLGRKPYERREGGSNHRNGSYPRRFTMKGIGEVEIKVPRDRQGTFKTALLPKGRQYDDAIAQDLSMLFLAGLSTRSLAMISRHLVGRKLSHTEISNANKTLNEAVEKWRNRDLSREQIQYLFVDGVNFDMRLAGSVEKVPVLVAVGVTHQGHKLVVGLQAGDKESASAWRELFKDLKQRGLDRDKVVLGVMDGLLGLEKVFKEEFPKARIQRCQVHVARNVLAKVPHKVKGLLADDLRSIFYASSLEKAGKFFQEFRTRWEPEVPSAVSCLERSLESSLTFFHFPVEHWVSLRTTNIIERLNKEFKRRTKPMEIVAGEISCYKLLAFISIKMEWPIDSAQHIMVTMLNVKAFKQASLRGHESPGLSGRISNRE
jgi:putative transposase